MNKQTIILAAITAGIIIVAVVVGVTQNTAPPQPQAQPASEQTNTSPVELTEEQLQAKLATEKQTISDALIAAYPKTAELYTISEGRLFGVGNYYGTTLTYIGPDDTSRDTLRVLMQKKDGVWVMRTKPPRLLLNVVDYPDVPKSILQTINQPAPLPGTDVSPAIN